jgi:hypothetical protein
MSDKPDSTRGEVTLEPMVRPWQVMASRSLCTFGVYNAATPDGALDLFARDMMACRGIELPDGYGLADHCRDTGAPMEYRTDDFRIFVY